MRRCLLSKLSPLRLKPGKLVAWLALLVVATGATVIPVQIQAQEEEITAVTATVVANTPPTTPILISPANNSTITTSLPTFVWERSTSVTGMSHYNLVLDGSNYFSNIPLTATDNANYILTFNNVTNRYSLTVKAPISDGNHTWKIRAVDINNLGTDSATWTFRIDTLAPSFVVTQIGEQATNISAQDVSTIPDDPIELTNNSPLIVATGEANSTVSMTVIIPGDPNQNYVVAIDGSGNWSQQLGILPRDVVMTLNFTITDQAGNVSVLNGVEFIILQEVIVFPPASPSPTPSPTPTPTPGVTPEPSPEPSPTLEPEPPLIEIPVTPPNEVVNEVIQEIIERLPVPIQQAIANLPRQAEQVVVETVELVAPVSSLVATAAVPTVTSLALLSQFGNELSLRLIIRLLQALGLLPKRKPQGLVYNSKTNEPVAFALLTVTSTDSSLEEPIHETVVTDVHGVYQGIKLPPGQYKIMVSHQDYTFPSGLTRPAYLSFQDFYLGEVFSVNSVEQDQLFLIPVDPVAERAELTNKNWRSKLRLLLARVRLADLMWPLFTFSLIIAVIFPSFLNWIIVGFYLIIIGRKALQSLKLPRIAGTVIDDQGQPISNAVIRLSDSQTNQLAVLTNTNAKGEFRGFVDKGKYQINVMKPGYIWKRGAGAELSFEELDVTTGQQYTVITMMDSRDLYKDLFGEI